MRKTTKATWLVVGCVVLSGFSLAGCRLTRWGYESATYNVVRKCDAFEIRDYPALTLVSTPMPSATPSGDESFMRLFRYISGANQSDTKIAMTTPVFIGLEGTNRQMSFVVPRKIAAAGAPNAKREDIKVESRSGGRFAVYRFRGGWDKVRAAVARQKLAEWLVAEKLVPAGEPQLANYDPPFTPAFLRRNEVMVRLADDKPESAK